MARISIPIETKVRELDGKLWLALNLLEHGHEVVLGRSSPVHSWTTLKNELQPDLHIEKSMTAKRKELFKNLSDSNALVGVLDSEGGVYPSRSKYVEKRVSTNTIQYVDKIFAWGEDSASAITESTQYPPDNICVTGNPRFDLLCPELREIYSNTASEIKTDFGEFILINTNFAAANHFKGNAIATQYTNDKVNYISDLLEKFIELIETLRVEFPELNIVIRPHPSEDHSYYKHYFRRDGSVFIKHYGDVREWIVASKYVIHNSCTTGIESALLNVPTLAYCPYNNPYHKRPDLPNRVSIKTTTIEGTVDSIQDNLDTPTYNISQNQRQHLSKYFANVDRLAAPIIANVIDNMITDNAPTEYPEPSFSESIEVFTKSGIVSGLYDFIRSERSEYSKQKFPNLSDTEILSRVNDFNSNIQIDKFTVKKINDVDYVYLLKPH